jgi:hypothetical protein
VSSQNLLLQKGVPLTRVRQVSTPSRKSARFLSLNTTLPLTLMDRFEFIILIVYLEKGAHEARGTLKQGEQEHSFG